MTDTSGPVYEVTFDVDREIVDQFDAWLEQHVADMLRSPGVYQAEVFEEEDDQDDDARLGGNPAQPVQAPPILRRQTNAKSLRCSSR